MKTKVCPECGESVQIESHYCGTCEKQLQKLKRNKVTIISILLLAIIASCALTGSQIIYRSYIYSSYQPSTCRTLDEQISTTSSDHSTSIDIDITYDLVTTDGEHIPGESHILVSDFNEAENLKNYYQVGSIYNCWYSAISPTHTKILRGDYLYFVPLLFILFDLPLFFFIFATLYLSIYKPLQFIKKGVQTRGTVMKRERKSKNNTSIIVFQTVTDPPITYGTVVPGRFKANTHLHIIYDPDRPQENVMVGDKKISQKFVVIVSVSAIFLVGMLVTFALMGFFL